jgi:predicted nucleotidyltransferase
MFKKNNKYRILKIFLFSPTDAFRLRELSRLSRISPLSVTNYLKEFEKEGLIKRFKKRDIPFYQAERDNEKFILFQKLSIIYELNESGLIEDLWNKNYPEAIILFGSFAKGEAVENSDVDIFIIGKEKKIDLAEFEKKLNKNIHLMFNSNIKKIPKELKNNLVNGIVLKGYLKIF